MSTTACPLKTKYLFILKIIRVNTWCWYNTNTNNKNTQCNRFHYLQLTLTKNRVFFHTYIVYMYTYIFFILSMKHCLACLQLK